MKILLGLGNPGKKYHNNRHNVGFMVIDALASELGVRFRKKAALVSAVAQAIIGNGPVLFAKPLTYMNNSGSAFESLCSFYKVSFGQVLVIYDDADLGLGTLRFAKSGSAGGHRGMSSVIEAAASRQIKRLRIGIGKSDRAELSDYVLSDFDSGELPALNGVIERSQQACKDWARCGIEVVMQKYNGKQMEEKRGKEL